MYELFVGQKRTLSSAWSEVFLKLHEHGTQILTPTIVTISEFSEDGSPVEDPTIRQLLDDSLAEQNAFDSHTVANTIFPVRLWRPQAGDTPNNLYQRYLRNWRIIAKNPANRHGVYFHRLIAYAPNGSCEDARPVNQLQHIIETYKKGNR